MVAAAYVAIALPEGGYGSDVRAIGTIALWGLVIVGLAFGIWPRTAIPRATVIAGCGLAGMAILTALSMLWSADAARSFQEAIRVLSYLGLFLCVVLSTRTGSARTWLNGLAIGVSLIGLISLLSALLPGLFPIAGVHEVRPDTRHRLAWPLDYWNGIGLVCTTGILLTAWTSAYAARRWVRALAAGVLPLLVLALALTRSEGSFAAIALGLIVLLAVDKRRIEIFATLATSGIAAVVLGAAAMLHPLFFRAMVETPAGVGQAHRMLVIVVIAAAAAGLARLLLDNAVTRLGRASPPTWARPVAIGLGLLAGLVLVVLVVTKFGQFTAIPEGSDAGGLDLSGNGRFQFWSSAMDAFATHPLIGIGAGTFNGWWAAHGTLPVFIQNAHSLPLETLAELGILGFAALGVFVLTPLITGVRRLREEFRDPGLGACLAIVVASLLSASIDWMWRLPAAFVPAVIAIGLLAGPALAAPSSGRSRFGFGILAILLGWVAILAAALSLFTAAKIDQAENAPDAGSALRYARQAKALQPWAADPVHQEMLALERAGDFPGSLAAIDQAIRLAPYDYELWREKARILQNQGDIPAAKQAGYGMIVLRPDLRLAGESSP